MAMYCEICGDELDTEKQAESICENCKKLRCNDFNYEKDEDFVDPAVT